MGRRWCRSCLCRRSRLHLRELVAACLARKVVPWPRSTPAESQGSGSGVPGGSGSGVHGGSGSGKPGGAEWRSWGQWFGQTWRRAEWRSRGQWFERVRRRGALVALAMGDQPLLVLVVPPRVVTGVADPEAETVGEAVVGEVMARAAGDWGIRAAVAKRRFSVMALRNWRTSY